MDKIKGVIFDLDGTLLDSVSAGVKSFRLTAQKLKLPPLSERIIRKQWGPPLNEIIKSLYPEVDIERFIKEYKRNLEKEKISIIPGTIKTLKALKSQNLILTLSTNRASHFFLEKLLEKLGIRKYLDFISSLTNTKPKPDPEALELLINFFQGKGIKKQEILKVGDSIVDFKSSQITGILFVGVLSGAAFKEDFIKTGVPEANIIPSIKKLPSWIFNYENFKKTR